MKEIEGDFVGQVFAMQTDRTRFQVLELELCDLLSLLPKGVDLDSVVQFSYQNQPMMSWWKAPKTRFLGAANCEYVMPDVSVWAGATLVLSTMAHAKLNEALKSSGDFFPITVERERFYIFICFVNGEHVYSGSENDEAVSKPDRLFVMNGAEDLMVFKLEKQNGAKLFCSERFKQLVESYGLKGICFRHVP